MIYFYPSHTRNIWCSNENCSSLLVRLFRHFKMYGQLLHNNYIYLYMYNERAFSSRNVSFIVPEKSPIPVSLSHSFSLLLTFSLSFILFCLSYFVSFTIKEWKGKSKKETALIRRIYEWFYETISFLFFLLGVFIC